MDGFIMGLKKFLPGNLEDLLGIFGIIGPIIGAVIAIQYLCAASGIERCFWSEEKKFRRKTAFWVILSVGMLVSDYIIALIMLDFSDAPSEELGKEITSSIKFTSDSIDKFWMISVAIIVVITVVLFLKYFYEKAKFRSKPEEDDMLQEMRSTEFIFCWLWVYFVFLVFLIDLKFLEDKHSIIWLLIIITWTIIVAYVLMDRFHKEEEIEKVWFRLKGDKRRYSVCLMMDDYFICKIEKRRNKKKRGDSYILIQMSQILKDKIELHIENLHNKDTKQGG